MNDQDAWLAAHTFYCERLKASITHRQCEINRGLPYLKDTGHERIHPERPVIHRYRPIPCEKCDGSVEITKGRKPMGMSPNVKAETLKALQESSSQSEAARKLGISQPSVYWRIKHDQDLMDVALRKGFIKSSQVKPADQVVPSRKGKKQEEPVPVVQEAELPECAKGRTEETCQLFGECSEMKYGTYPDACPCGSGKCEDETERKPAEVDEFWDKVGQDETKGADHETKQALNETPPPIEHDLKFEPYYSPLKFVISMQILGVTLEIPVTVRQV